MTLPSSLLGTRTTRAAVVLVAALHAVMLLGFAQYDHTRSNTGHRLAAPNDYQPVAVFFVAAQTSPVQSVQASVPAPPLRPTPTTFAHHRPADAPQTQQASSEKESQPHVPRDAPTSAGVAVALLQDRLDNRLSAPAIARSEEAKSEAQPLQAAKPDYAYNPQPDYPLLLREQGVGGVVWLRVWVDSEGHPGEIKLAKGSGYRLLDDAALRAVRQWRFVPAKKGEQKLASWVEFPIRFTLNG
nr:energy transducer TonB [uncultured Rhodoferax sp.]